MLRCSKNYAILYIVCNIRVRYVLLIITDNETLPVLVNIIERSWEDPVFTNEPEHIMASVPAWIRPGETFMSEPLMSLDAADFGCDVHYMLQSGSVECAESLKPVSSGCQCRRHCYSCLIYAYV